MWSNFAQFGADIFTNPCGFIAEYDPNGTALQAFPLGCRGNIDPVSFLRTPAGEFVIAARLSGVDTIGSFTFNNNGASVLLLKYDSNGNLIWLNEGEAESFGTGYNDPYDLCMDAAGNSYVTCLIAFQNFIFGNDTVFMHPNATTSAIIKFDSNGNVDWIRQPSFTGTENVYFNDVTCDQNGIYFTGYTDEDFTVGSVSVSDNTNAYHLFFMIAMDLSGNPLYEQHTTGNNSIALPKDITVDATGRIWISGMHSNAPSFGPFAMTDPPSGVDYGFLLQMQVSGVGISEPVLPNAISLLNTSDAQMFTLQVDGSLVNETVRCVLYDITGRIVKTVAVTSENTMIDCRDISSGVYTWSVENSEDRFASGKLLNQ